MKANIGPGDQSLSHANLYGQVILVPAAAWRLGSGLVGLIGTSWRRLKAQIPNPLLSLSV